MKNIAIIVPTLNKGGAERVAANMSLEFAKRYNTYVIVHDGSSITYPYGGTLIDLKLPPSKSKLGKVTTLLRRIAALRRIKKQYQIDVSISHLPAANNANVLSRRGDRVFTYVHSMLRPSGMTPLRERLTALLSDRVICVSECARQNMIRNFGIPEGKTSTVYNFCDLTAPARPPAHPGFRVVTMGRLCDAKGQWHLIRAMKRVTEKLEGATLTLVGEGELREPLEALVKKLGLEERIRFAGFQQEPWPLLAEADLYVSSSMWEGLPMALVEAGRCGLPILSTDCDSGCREILAPDTPVDRKTRDVEPAKYGVLIPVCPGEDMESEDLSEQEELLADAILALAADPGLRKKYAALAAERSGHFRPEAIMKQWEELLE